MNQGDPQQPIRQDADTLLSVRNLKKHFPVLKGIFNKEVGRVRAVDGVQFDIFRGECFGLVGESGSGKTTVGRTILRVFPPTEGEILFNDGQQVHDISNASKDTLKHLRRHLQMIFQDPYSSLNPRMTLCDIVGEPLLVNGMRNRKQREHRVRQLLAQVGLKPDFLKRYPHAFSGGQRQRIGIARALALEPDFIVADEPVSALDVSVQAQVLNLLQELQETLNLTYLFIAHDLSVVRHICDRVAVMYVGQLMELAETEAIFDTPMHPYTEALLSAAPVPDPNRESKKILLSGEIADPGNPPPGCVFHPRCRYAKPLCANRSPDFTEPRKGHWVRCHYTDSLNL